MKALTALCPLTAAAAAGQDPRPAAHKVEFRSSDTSGPSREGARVYSQITEDNMKGVLRVGRKVPLGNSFHDVGMNLEYRLRLVDGGFVADVDLELSNLDGTQIQQIRTHTTARVLPGKAVVITSFHDPVLQRRLDLEITVNRAPKRRAIPATVQ